MKRLKDQSGFTLLELMIAITLMTAVIGGIYNFLGSATTMSASMNKMAQQHNMLLTTNQ